MIRQLLNLPLVSAWMLGQILASAWAVVRAALSPAPMGPPVIVRYELRGRSDLQATVLAWAITVTPSTLVLAVGEDELYVHCVLGGDRDELVAGFADMERRLLGVLAPPSDPVHRPAHPGGREPDTHSTRGDRR